MKILLKKKSLQKAMKDLASMGKIAKPVAGTSPALRIVADEKSVRFQVGFETVFANITLPESEIADPGTIAVPQDDFARIANLSGDEFFLETKGTNLAYNVGKVNGQLASVDDTTIDLEAVKANLNIMAFGKVLKTAELLAHGSEYLTLVFSPAKEGETTGTLRVEALSKGSETLVILECGFEGTIPDESSVSLSMEAVAAIVGIMKGSARVGYNDTVLTIRDSGASLVLRQHGARPLNLDGRVDELLARPVFNSFTVSPKDLNSVLKDIIVMSADHVQVSVEAKAAFQAKSENTNTNVDVDFPSYVGQKATAVFNPTLLQRVLGTFEEALVRVNTYENSFAIHSMEKGEAGDGELTRQMAMLAFRESVAEEVKGTGVDLAKLPAKVEEPVKKAKAVKPVEAPEPVAKPVEKKAPPTKASPKPAAKPVPQDPAPVSQTEDFPEEDF